MNFLYAIVCAFIGHNMHGTQCGKIGRCTECGWVTRATIWSRYTW
jgi:hypothetical protein